jgi:two-component system, LytTR family, response regulator
MLAKHPEINVVDECGDGSAALTAVQNHQPDLILLDIQMPGMDGFDVADALRSPYLPLIVFVTAFDEHAIRAFEACALDYLLKPASAARLAKTIARVHYHLSTVIANPLEATEVTSSAPIKFQVRSGQRTSFVSADEIEWIEADGNYAVLHVGDRNHLLRATMFTLEKDLPGSFLRVSRSAIVNLKHVRELQSPDGDHFAVMKNEKRVAISRSIREVRERWHSV